MYTWTILQVNKTSYVYLDNFFPFPITLFHCSAWPRLKLNTKIGLHTHHPPPTHHTNSQAAISQLLLARFGSNFKQRVLGTYTTDYNCHHDICPGNICPGDICPYQQYKYFQAEHFRLQSCIIQYILCNTYYRIHTLQYICYNACYMIYTIQYNI